MGNGGSWVVGLGGFSLPHRWVQVQHPGADNVGALPANPGFRQGDEGQEMVAKVMGLMGLKR